MAVDPDGAGDAVPQLYILGTDHLGTPWRAWDRETGEIVWAADYEVFGKAWTYVPRSTDEPLVQVNLRFPGQYFDEETGLHYNWHRYYDPDTGRYLQPDPAAQQPYSDGEDLSVKGPLGPSSFHYADNSPMMFFDPNGFSAMGPSPGGWGGGLGSTPSVFRCVKRCTSKRKRCGRKLRCVVECTWAEVVPQREWTPSKDNAAPGVRG